MSDSKPLPTSKNSPTGNQQDLPQVPVGIEHPDARPVSSEGNQALKEAAEHLDADTLASNLKAGVPDHPETAAEQTTAPFAGYATGKVEDTSQSDS